MTTKPPKDLVQITEPGEPCGPNCEGCPENHQNADFRMKQSSDVTTTIPTSDITDCGTHHYLHVLSVKPPQHDHDGIMIYAGDLVAYKDRYYLDETTNTLKRIQGNETHLYGKHVQIRSVMFCRFTPKGNYCQVCMGKSRSKTDVDVGYPLDQFRHKNLLSEGRGLFLDLLRTTSKA